MKKWIYAFMCMLMSFQTMLFSQESAEPPPRDQGFWQMIMIFAICGIFFYLILWRPEQKRRKAMEDVRTSLKKGDRITAMGILGTVVKVQDQTVVIKLYDGAKMEVLKGAITEVIPESDEEGKKTEIEDKTASKKED